MQQQLLICNLACELETMEQSIWHADKQLDVYICDYLIRKKWIRTAESLIAEGKVSPKNVVGIDTPEGHLFDCWSLFWETHLARVNAKRSETASGNLEAQQIQTEEQQLQRQQLQLMSQAQLHSETAAGHLEDDGDGMDLFGTSKQNLSDHATAIGISFSEAGCMRKSNSEVVCCHFSSDGKFLASAGHDKQVFLWNFETRQIESTPVGHLRIISEVRFRPNSTLLATSSLDHTVRLWDAGNPSFSMPYYGTSPLLSLDFHPKKNDLLCSCGNNNEIRIWNIDQNSCIRVSKGGTARVRFQPRIGHLLAAASGNAVTLFDFETDREVHKLQGHSAGVSTVCWDTNGDYVTSVSQDSVKVWSVASGNCVRELNSSGHMYRSCVFHPRHSNVLVIGLNQSLALWNMAENKWMTIPAHDCLIPALATSPVTGMIASASHDKSVKIWK